MTRVVCNNNRVGHEVDSIFNGLMNHPMFTAQSESAFAPRVNIRESDETLALTFQLPGVEQENVKVTVKDNTLTVSGERKFDEAVEGERLVRTEFGGGEFSRSFTLPRTINTEDVAADYRHGLLTVSFPKKEEVKPREIEVKVT